MSTSSLEEGGSLGIVGESGSGKSTLVRILLGLDRATAGEVRYRDRVIAPGKPRELRWFRRDAQIVLQDPLSSLDPRMTIASIVREPLVCLDVPGDHDERITEVLEAVGLDPSWRHRYPHEFSGGQQQRIAIARAIAPRPRLLVGDEPVSALDVSVRVQILDLLRGLADEYELSLVLVSHDLGVVRYLCDDVVVLRDGLVVERGTDGRRLRPTRRTPTPRRCSPPCPACPRQPATVGESDDDSARDSMLALSGPASAPPGAASRYRRDR